MEAMKDSQATALHFAPSAASGHDPSFWMR